MFLEKNNYFYFSPVKIVNTKIKSGNLNRENNLNLTLLPAEDKLTDIFLMNTKNKKCRKIKKPNSRISNFDSHCIDYKESDKENAGEFKNTNKIFSEIRKINCYEKEDLLSDSCRCKKMCLKNYCLCRKTKKVCGSNCICFNCENL